MKKSNVFSIFSGNPIGNEKVSLLSKIEMFRKEKKEFLKNNPVSKRTKDLAEALFNSKAFDSLTDDQAEAVNKSSDIRDRHIEAIKSNELSPAHKKVLTDLSDPELFEELIDKSFEEDDSQK